MENILTFTAVAKATKSTKDNHNYALELRSSVVDAIVASFRGEEIPEAPKGLTQWGKGYVRGMLKAFCLKAKFEVGQSNEDRVNSIELAWGFGGKDASAKTLSESRAKSVMACSERAVLQAVEEALNVPSELWFKPHKEDGWRV